MQEFKEKRRPAGWRSSEGRMRERMPVREKEGRPHLTGYEAKAGERDRDRPREAGRIGGYYGDAAVGVSRNKELTLVVSKKQSRDGPAATESEKKLRGDSAVRMNLARRDFRTNSSDKDRSAVSYRETSKKPASFMLSRFRDLVQSRDQSVLKEQMAFLDQRPEREGMQKLQQEADSLRAKGAKGEELRSLYRKKEELRQSLVEKKQQERRLQRTLRKAREEAQKLAKHGEDQWIPDILSVLSDEPPEKPEGEHPDPNGEDQNKPPKAEKAQTETNETTSEEPEQPAEEQEE